MKKIWWAAALAAGIVCLGVSATAAETEADAAAEAATEAAAADAAEDGEAIITADEWEATFPDIVESYEQNAENSYTVSYLEEDPYLVNLYEGYGFAKDYDSARGHSYTLEDVNNTERPHALANCLTCKTADFTKMVNDIGEEVYASDFEEVYASMNENVGCYTCHANNEATLGEDGTNLVVTHTYLTDALGEDYDGIAAQTLSCGQCHIEYYFDPETKATKMPHTDIASMTAEATLAYYDEIGFSDWTQESTGTGMLKAQHPELETFLTDGSKHAAMGLTCADCHMGTSTSDNGNAFVNHYWRSPLEDEDLLVTCAKCHGDTDMTEKVHAIQDEITALESTVGNRLSDLKDSLAEAVASGEYGDGQLDEIRSLYRSAQWYWDYCYVENSEGAHNSTYAKELLGKSEELIGQAEEKIAALSA